MASRIYLGLLLVLLVCFYISSSFAYVFYVGGKDGWVSNPHEKYNDWAGRNRFSVNDTLVFKYNNGTDSVLLVNKDDYYNCNAKNRTETMHSGTSVFKFDRSGPFYFITGNKENCEKGQRLVVVVLATKPIKGSPPTPSSPSPPSSPPLAHSPSPYSPSPKSSSPIAKPPSSAHTPIVSPVSPSPKSPSPVAKPPSSAHVPAFSPSPKSPSPGGNPPSSAPTPSPTSPNGQTPSLAPSPAAEKGPVTSPIPSATSPSPAGTAESPGAVTSPSPSSSTTPPPGSGTGSGSAPPPPPGNGTSANVTAPAPSRAASLSACSSLGTVCLLVTAVLSASLLRI